MTNDKSIRLALPSKGALERSTVSLLAACGLNVSRPNERQYVGSIPALPNLTVLFQRAADIFTKVEEGSADLGITGYDVVAEQGVGQDNVVVICDRLGYGRCQLVVAVPESWIDVSSIEDLAELTLLFKEKGRTLRIATKYPNLTRNWLYEKLIVHFSLVEVQGAMEAAPSMGYADMIVDITSTGTTLRENRLKQIDGGSILDSQACLIGNKRLLQEDETKLEITKTILELIEANLRAKKYISVTANVQGNSADEIGNALMTQSQLTGLTGLRGPTIAKVYSHPEDNWYAVTVVIEQKMLLSTVNLLRKAGGRDMTVLSPNYVFSSESQNYQQFLEKLK
ncbi:MAG TPA: ATP phosphoribosyltransferase [Cyanobacteria bacterium UBA11149]|nr:ATP phosphoribosyltransferase [Cyanobacteria bacterium UBA11367]HBE58101.1 ATP phosphoribosyltransferase [Cyanobacteria bacterium UBA11366]HBK65362.1 ATP phosphoribosyltransferase [Cyanobacteria bacterium UBA11166]HBR76680.1 ATP phosphoribosyltransferase [Cyanobacteria bacterium UBA11159]HBS68055.1 ATP phosphoribosyltransferase [Cyanobacteria bacterium UBA11153]HBW88755.1 ATP phosphoribosyltransferase [Cyanobacteria bacterium UBA11149]HCA95275.1 ATP phosphoribosyltransferase [Cyanobacteria